MKKMHFLIVFTIISAQIVAQEIEFTFISKDAGNQIDSIKAANLNNQMTAFVKGSNIVTQSSFSTGTSIVSNSPEQIKVYPNPFFNKAELQFHSSVNEMIKVSLINVSGQSVAEHEQNVTSGLHKFEISATKKGIYFLNFAGQNVKLTAKILSVGNSGLSNEIKYLGNLPERKYKKSASFREGDLIHFLLYSGGKITKIADTPIESKTYEVEFYECKDANRKNYPIVHIGEQWWMAENLAVSAGNSSWAYDNSAGNIQIYGRLYNWEAAKNYCPTGWYLPNDADWAKLENYLSSNGYNYDGSNSGNKVAKSLAAANTVWNSSSKTGAIGNDLSANDKSGFSALPGGYHTNTGVFGGKEDHGAWWSATLDTDTRAWGRYLHYSEEFLNPLSLSINKGNGFSVRCVKD